MFVFHATKFDIIFDYKKAIPTIFLLTPDVAAALDRVLANIRSLSDKSKEWLDAKSETFTALCGTEGDIFTRRDVVRAHLYLAGVFVIMCVAGWLEGGAA